MRILHRYILSNFLVTFAMSMAVLTFVMMVGLVFESLKYIARGMDAMLVVRFLWQNLPGTLSYSVPVSLLVSSLLVFSRLSSDSEISAMRSCGVPLAAIMRTPVLFAALMSLVCLHVNDNVSPDAAYSRALRRKTFKATDVMALLEPRTWIDMGDYDIFVARRDGEILQDLRVNQPLPGGRTREIRAASAHVATNGEGRAMLMMTDVTIDPWRDDEPGMSHAATWQLPLSAISGRDDQPARRGRGPVRRAKDQPTWALVRDVAVAYRDPPVRPGDLEDLAEFERTAAEARHDFEHPEAAVSNAVVRAAENAIAAAGADLALLAATNAAAGAGLASLAATNAVSPLAALTLFSNALASASAPDLDDAIRAATAAGLTNAVEAADGRTIAELQQGELAARVVRAEARLARARADLKPRLRAEKELSRAKVEIGVRATLAAACLCFVLVGIPLGIQSHRRESSVGIGLSLAIAGAFYFFCITAESLSKHPELRAHWLLPVPVAICVALHVWLMHRHE